MGDLISRGALVSVCKQIASDDWNKRAAPVSWADAYESFIEELEEAPTVDAVKVVHAHKAESAFSHTGLMCTACYSDVDKDAVFCKYCGAEVDGGSEE